MHHTINLRKRSALYTKDALLPVCTTALFIGESCTGYQPSEPDAYARRIADAAEAWLRHAGERSRMKDSTLVSKAIHSVAFSLQHRTNDYAVPSKLSGTSKCQPALWGLVRGRAPFGTPLDIKEVREEKRIRLIVSVDSEVLGEIQPKHLGWFRPLLAFGAGVYLTRVTGHEERWTLGCNVVLARLGKAIEALNRALGVDLEAGDGYGGDGATVTPAKTGIAASRTIQSGDGTSDSPPPAPTVEDDIRFWRDGQGVVHMNIPHVQKHSAAVEIAYRGSGPADSALSVLSAVTSRDQAERLYQLYKEDVIAQLNPSGATITRASVRAWLAAHADVSPEGHGD